MKTKLLAGLIALVLTIADYFRGVDGLEVISGGILFISFMVVYCVYYFFSYVAIKIIQAILQKDVDELN